MGAFTESNVPGGNPGASARAAIEYAKAYDIMHSDLSAHVSEKAGTEGVDPHGIKAYIDAIESKAKDTANTASRKVDLLEKFLVGTFPRSGFTNLGDCALAKIGDTNLLDFIIGLINRIKDLEDTVNTLNLLQFDNVPVGAGIRWWKDTLPEDGTYVWANGQTLYGVNQNFPELARAWEIGSADNVKVPKEDHTIFKVRKATVEIKPIEHAYISTAANEGE